MSRFLTENDDGTYLEEIDDLEVCKWNINEVCCNSDCDYVADFPSIKEKCCIDSKFRCPYFEKDDGIIDNKKAGD